MTQHPPSPTQLPAPYLRPPTQGSGWVAAIIVVAISILSTFTMASPESDPAGVQYVPVDDGGQPTGLPDDLATGDADVGGAAGPTVRRVARDGNQQLVGGEAGTTNGPGGQGSQGEDTAGTAADCPRGQNAGATDTGITADRIRLAATVVKTGIAKDFLSDAQFGIEAVVQKQNRAGGICGRLLEVTYDDDGWDPGQGQRIIEKWIGQKRYFGLIVNPSSEGLRLVIKNGLLSKNQFPVVGADGMLIGQYKEPWVWPVATSTLSVMHIMVKKAIADGAETFGIVWERNYRFGEEGHAAFVGAVKRAKKTLVVDRDIQGATSGGSSITYGPQAEEFVGKCKKDGKEWAACDFVAVLLEPATAAQWVNDGGLGSGTDGRPAVGIGAPQPLFVDSFIRDCGAPCNGMQVWTSFKPPIAPFDSDPAVQEYVADLRAVSSSADASNPHVQGAYVGARLMVEGLEQLGPAPTRQKLREVLDGMTFDSGLAPPLEFSDGNHFAAVSAQAFEAIFNVNSFTTWRYAKTGFVTDDDSQKDHLED